MLFFSLHPLPLVSLPLLSFHSGDGDSVESQSEQGQSQVAPGSDADVQVSPSPEDPDQGLPELDQGGNTSHRHQDTGQDQQVRGSPTTYSSVLQRVDR